MSIYTQLKWPIVDPEAVCAKQTASGMLTLNGTLKSNSIPDQISFIASDMIRSLSMKSTDDLSGTNFIVEGLQNNAYVTETFGPTGTTPSPNKNTVYGTKQYDIITKITIDTPITGDGVSVGTGTNGYLPLIVVNPNATAINYSFSLLLKTGTIDYTMYQTLDSINTNFIPFSKQTLFEFPGVVNLNGSTLKNSTAITNFLLLKINSSVDATSFDFAFLQE